MLFSPCLREVASWCVSLQITHQDAEYPRQESFNRSVTREKHRFGKSLPSIRPCLKADRRPWRKTAETKDRDGWRGGRFIRGTGAWQRDVLAAAPPPKEEPFPAGAPEADLAELTALHG